MNITYCPFCLSETDGAVCSHCGRNIFCTVDPTHLQPGYVLNGTHPYVLGAALGQGGFGITYIALDTVTNRRVAIKEYFPTYCACRGGEVSVMPYRNQEDAYVKGMERFLEEAGMLRDLSDLDSVVDVLDFFERNNSAYLVMEFLEGSSLKDRVEKQGIFPAQPFLEQLKPLMADMRRMHRRGVVHRDIAPDNIIMLPDGRLKLIDFGAARSYLGDRSMTVVVKKGFAPVEQYMRKGTGACTDIYALAATVYYCVTGVVPPESAERQYDKLRLLAPSALGADITPAQERALEKALEIQPSDRTQSMAEFMEQLFPAGEKPVHAKTEKPKKEEQEAAPVSDQEQDQEEPPVRDPRKWIIAAAAAVALLAVIGIAVGISSLGKEKPKPQPSVQVTEAPAPETKPDLRRKCYMKGGRFGYDTRAFGPSIEKNQVRHIVFLDTLESAPENVYDLSEKQDLSVQAWMDAENVMYIAADGLIVAPENSGSMFSGFSAVEEISFNDCFDTSEVTDMSGLFAGCSALKKLDLSSFDTRNVSKMDSMFRSCSSLKTLDLSSFDTSSVTDMDEMFCSCSALKNLDLSSFDTRNVTDMRRMFRDCFGLETLDLGGFDTSAVIDMGSMFYNCSALKKLDLSSFDTRNVTDMHNMFSDCSALESLDVSGFDTSAVISMKAMFCSCSALKKLDLSSFDTRNVTDMSYMFYSCSSLKSLDLSSFDTWNVINMDSMFARCSGLETLDLRGFDFSNVTNASDLFLWCERLVSVNVGSINLPANAQTYTMFDGCPAFQK